jgi:hypothetical protein
MASIYDSMKKTELIQLARSRNLTYSKKNVDELRTMHRQWEILHRNNNVENNVENNVANNTANINADINAENNAGRNDGTGFLIQGGVSSIYNIIL